MQMEEMCVCVWVWVWVVCVRVCVCVNAYTSKDVPNSVVLRLETARIPS